MTDGLTVQTDSTDSGSMKLRTSVIRLDRPGDPGVFDERVRGEAAQLIARYPPGRARSALQPMLHLVQSEQGYVTPDGIAFCAEQLGLSSAQVAAAASFYTMYKRVPTGEYLVSVCTNALCGILGGDDIFAALREDLGIANDQTTADGAITLEHVECLAACDYAPVVTVNYEFFDNQSVGSARNLVSQLRSGERPSPTRGAPLCTFRQIERQIAGFFDDDVLTSDLASSGGPTEAGVRLALHRGAAAPSYPHRGERADPAVAEQAGSRSSQQPTSAHDAPLSTSASDPAHPSTQPGPSDDGQA